MNIQRQRVAARWVMLILIPSLLTACATPRPTDSPGQSSWSGRLVLKVESTPPQSFAAGFDLQGSPVAGQLLFMSPLGNTVASVRWTPGSAELRQGEQVTRRATLDELTTELAGTAVPVVALFAWLSGDAVEASGWKVDLSGQAEGRLFARRTQPLPIAELRIILQP